MSNLLQASITVQYGPDNSQGGLQWEQDTERQPAADNQLYVRLYPAHPDHLIVSSGNLSKSGSAYKQHSETLVFSGSRTEGLSYDKAEQVVTQQIGTMFDKQGQPVNVTLDFDSTRNVVRASQEVYGVCKVTYQAPYQLYLFTFSGTPCETVYVQGQGFVTTGGYNEATILAINFNPDSSASLTLTPTACGQATVTVQRQKEAELPSLSFEVHQDHPPRVTALTFNDDPLRASCKLKLYPDVAASVYTSYGSIIDASEQGQEKVKDVQTFSTSTSVNLIRQPIGSISIKAVSPFINKWGSVVTPSFAKPGDTVTEVDWLNEQTFNNPRPRKVLEDEIVALGLGNKVIEVSGSIEMEYVTDFRVYELRFELKDINYPKNGFNHPYVIAYYNGQVAQINPKPPSLEEN